MFNVQEHKIYKDILENLSAIAKKLHDAKKMRAAASLSPKEDFLFDLFHFLNEIDNKFKDLNLTLSFISTFPNYKPWRKVMRREEYVIYHLQYHYINIIALFDRILHLVNFLYDLGLADRHVTLDCIVKNRHVEKRICQILKTIDKALQSHRSIQNNIKHKGHLRLDDMYFAALLEFNLTHKALIAKWSKQSLKELQQDCNDEYRLFLSKKKKELKESNEILGKMVNILLDDLLVQYSKRFSIFQV